MYSSVIYSKMLILAELAASENDINHHHKQQKLKKFKPFYLFDNKTQDPHIPQSPEISTAFPVSGP